MSQPFDFEPASFIPFRDKAALAKARSATRDDIANLSNPNLDIEILPDSAVVHHRIADMIARIAEASRADKPLVMLTGNPNPGYANVARMINRMRLDCRKLHVFAVDEWANEQGRIAPESYPQSFVRAMKQHFYYQIDEDLRPPIEQFQGPSDTNVKDYSRMIADLGGADICYTGAGWSGHMAFIDPDSPELDLPLDEWKKVGTSIVTLSPYTILQNSLHASFGRSGDAAAVPPKAATIGPADILAAKARYETCALAMGNSAMTWQRMTTRLMLFGPVTPKIPNSILQTVPTKIVISETVASPIEPDWYGGY